MDQKILNLIKDLTVKTSNREANWEANSTDNYTLTLKSGRIFIKKFKTVAGKTAYQFSVYNLKGDSIFNMSKAKNPNLSIDEDFQNLSNLYENVIKKVYKIDETIDGILDEIKKNGQIGEDTSPPF